MGMGHGIVHDKVIGISLDYPEPKRTLGQILTNMPAQRGFGEQIASPVNSILDAICSVHTVAGDVTLDSEEIINGLRREPIRAHP